MKGKLIGVMLALAVMASSMALAQTHQDRDHDRYNAKVKKSITKIHTRAGSKTVTIVKKQKGDNVKDKDAKKTVTKRTVKKVWTRGSKPMQESKTESYHKTVPHESNAVFQNRLRRYRASWHHKRVVRKTVIVHRKVVRHNRGRHRGWWIGKGNRKHHHNHNK